MRLIAQRLNIESLTRHETGWASLDACYRYFDNEVAAGLNRGSEVDRVYAYEDGALATFRRAKELGWKCIYDLPIAHWQTSKRIMEEESERMPSWRDTLTAVHDSPAKHRRKDEELALADAVICPSQFVADSIPESIRAVKPVHVIPFGSPTPPKPTASAKASSKLRVLFAGSMSQRKGLGDLMAAMHLLDPNHFELHVLGSPLAPMTFYQQQLPGFIHHPPRPHDEVLKLMQSCDVFALPSLVEGRALVQQEALACGLPIIVTANAGAEDLVADEKAGFLVPIRSPEAIAEKLQYLRDHPAQLQAMQAVAPQKAAEVTWENYRKAIVQAVSSI
ncbi:glycosyltransferase family 4 protein [Cerasicoccus fimbriatus]|uniref:glycosyltransferase family 4 protein n=1 Tax=Cerasicoccus fimbriatus TaxID=3014554 RepID=UPI0022B2FE59|nr:glycosyltransferase family 4 protein [Cerasicoccus sp. TK19100]